MATRVGALGTMRDRTTGSWQDVEACCAAGHECIVFCGEAMQFATDGRYRAAPHRVVHAADQAARLSTVFELRIHDATSDAAVAAAN